MSCGGMQPCIDKIILRSFKIQAFGLLDELDFLKVGEGVHKVLPDGSDGVAVDEGFDVDDFRLEPLERSVIFDDQFPGSCGRRVACAEDLGFLQFSLGGGEGVSEEVFELGVWHGADSLCGRIVDLLYDIPCMRSVFKQGFYTVPYCLKEGKTV